AFSPAPAPSPDPHPVSNGKKRHGENSVASRWFIFVFLTCGEFRVSRVRARPKVGCSCPGVFAGSRPRLTRNRTARSVSFASQTASLGARGSPCADEPATEPEQHQAEGDEPGRRSCRHALSSAERGWRQGGRRGHRRHPADIRAAGIFTGFGSAEG